MVDLKFLDSGRFQPAPTAIPEGLSQVRAYWEALRRGGGIPPRAALDPRGFGGVLDRVFLAERIGRGLAQVRIAGSGLAEFAGLDLRGLPLSCLFSAEARPVLAQVMERVFAGAAVAELDLGSDRAKGAVARLLLLPLADGERRLVLGCLGFAGGRIGAACKFSILRRQEERLAPATAKPVEDAPLPGRRFGHLTLVDINA